ncbi:MAG: TatD family hydrolase [archaeon]|nr:TatD family hydrolase [archaeon]
MVYIDTHCHIERYGDKIEDIVKRAINAGVKIIVNNGANPEGNRETLELASKFKEIRAALGFHPTEVSSSIDDEIKFINKNRSKIVALGEVGMDFSSDATDEEKQREDFQKIIDLSLKIKIPMMVHSRKAEEAVIKMLEYSKAKKVVMHCFSGNMKLVKKIIENKWMLSIPASVKYNAHFQKVVEITPITQLLCETDSPYLHPDRKENNEPAFVVEAYKKIAEIKKLKIEEVEKIIEGNYNKMFLD